MVWLLVNTIINQAAARPQLRLPLPLSTGWVKKKKNRDLKQNGHNYSEIRQKKKKLVCFGIKPLKWLRKMNIKLATRSKHERYLMQ